MGVPEPYEIRIEGQLRSASWAYWFDGLIAREDASGETVLSGLIVDQAALYGILDKLRDLNMKLISVKMLGKRAATTTDGSSSAERIPGLG